MKHFQSVTGLSLPGLYSALLVTLVCILSLPGTCANGDNVFLEGSFDSAKIDPGGQTGWWGVTGDKVKIVEKDGQRWLRLENSVPGRSAQSGRRFPLNPDW